MTRTENDAKALLTTQSNLVDLFATIGAMRGATKILIGTK